MPTNPSLADNENDHYYLRPYRGKKSDADNQNILLRRGEIFIEYLESGIGTGIGRMKMGDGTTLYRALPYLFDQTDLSASFLKSFTPTTVTNDNTLLGNIANNKDLATMAAATKKLIENRIAKEGSLDSTVSAIVTKLDNNASSVATLWSTVMASTSLNNQSLRDDITDLQEGGGSAGTAIAKLNSTVFDDIGNNQTGDSQGAGMSTVAKLASTSLREDINTLWLEVFQNQANGVGNKRLQSNIEDLKTNFQAGVDSVYDAIYARGTTPASKSLSDVVAAIGLIETKHTGTYKPLERKNNNDMGEVHYNRYVDTTAVPNYNEGLFYGAFRSYVDLGEDNDVRYVDTRDIENYNDEAYTFPAGNGDTVHLGETNKIESVNANNVYSYGYNTGSAAGYNAGSSAGYSAGYSAGSTDGYNAGYSAGSTDGYSAGSAAGYSAGSAAGYSAGSAAGYQNGYSAGTADGYSAGSAAGYQNGYNVGYTDGRNSKKGVDILNLGGAAWGLGGGSRDSETWNTGNNKYYSISVSLSRCRIDMDYPEYEKFHITINNSTIIVSDTQHHLYGNGWLYTYTAIVQANSNTITAQVTCDVPSLKDLTFITVQCYQISE